MLQVITHNGRPVSEGGLRIGYRAADPQLGTVFTPCGGGAPTLAQLLAIKANGHSHAIPTSPAFSAPPIQFKSLRTRSYTGYCSDCFSPVPERLGRLTVTDEGEKILFDCPGCGITLRNKSLFS